MNFSLVYLVQRFFYRIGIFLYDWYVGSFFVIGKASIDTLERLDRYWALKITVKNLFQPLYQDRSLVGRVLGFFFRTSRALIASVLYIFVIFIFGAVYVAWAGLPIYIITRGFSLKLL